MAFSGARIPGWTQMDEDQTFGRNGFDREWLGDEAPTLEAQRVLKDLRTKLAARIRDAAPKFAARPTQQEVKDAIETQLQDARDAGFLV